VIGNPWAGEVCLTIDGTPHVLKLTLGTLAELEDGLKADTLSAMVARFETGSCSTGDVLALVIAGLRGGGWQGQAKDLLQAEIEGGPMVAAQAAAHLLVRAFSVPEGA